MQFPLPRPGPAPPFLQYHDAHYGDDDYDNWDDTDDGDEDGDGDGDGDGDDDDDDEDDFELSVLMNSWGPSSPRQHCNCSPQEKLQMYNVHCFEEIYFNADH